MQQEILATGAFTQLAKIMEKPILAATSGRGPNNSTESDFQAPEP